MNDGTARNEAPRDARHDLRALEPVAGPRVFFRHARAVCQQGEAMSSGGSAALEELFSVHEKVCVVTGGSRTCEHRVPPALVRGTSPERILRAHAERVYS